MDKEALHAGRAKLARLALWEDGFGFGGMPRGKRCARVHGHKLKSRLTSLLTRYLLSESYSVGPMKKFGSLLLR